MPPARAAALLRPAGRSTLSRMASSASFAPLALLRVEVGRHILHERGRHHRLDVDQSQVAAAHFRQFESLGEPFGRGGRFGEVDRKNNALVHKKKPSIRIHARDAESCWTK